jgi:hypothetical protein
MLKLKNPSFTPENCVNIMLHVTILFTLLSLLFKYYISNITEKTINSEIDNIIDNSVADSNTHNLHYGILIREINNTQKNVSKHFTNNTNQSENHAPNSYDYYYDLFSKRDVTVKTSNDKVFFYINFVNILLVLMLLLVTFYFYKTNNILGDDIKIIVLENVLTFGFVGIIEYVFFTNVALKYSAITPTLLYSSFIDSFKKNLKY